MKIKYKYNAHINVEKVAGMLRCTLQQRRVVCGRMRYKAFDSGAEPEVTRVLQSPKLFHNFVTFFIKNNVIILIIKRSVSQISYHLIGKCFERKHNQTDYMFLTDMVCKI